MSTTQTTGQLVTITVTETVERTYVLFPANLETLGLPISPEELAAMDTDELGVTLIDNAEPEGFEVTERDIEISATQ